MSKYGEGYYWMTCKQPLVIDKFVLSKAYYWNRNGRITCINISASVENFEIKALGCFAAPKTQGATHVAHITRNGCIVRNSIHSRIVLPQTPFVSVLHTPVEVDRECKLLSNAFPWVSKTQPVIGLFVLESERMLIQGDHHFHIHWNHQGRTS